VPTVTLSANPTSLASGGTTSLSWSSANTTSCTASNAWSGAKSTVGSLQSAALTAASNTFTLNCTGTNGSSTASAVVSVSGASGSTTGLNFPSNGDTTNDVRFRFTGTNLLPMYPATYIWRIQPRQQSSYYTTFFWGQDGAYTGQPYYGAHPYPDGGSGGTSHKWEVAAYGGDFVAALNAASTVVQYGTWKTQALRVFDDGTNKVHEFYFDLPDTSKVIITKLHQSYGTPAPSSPALVFGDAPWNIGNERLSGVLRGIQLYSGTLSVADILAEISSPLSTASGSASVWYLNMNPTPSDISDKSGKSHHPSWVSSSRPTLWSAP
jgi:hypothetical protein